MGRAVGAARGVRLDARVSKMHRQRGDGALYLSPSLSSYLPLPVSVPLALSHTFSLYPPLSLSLSLFLFLSLSFPLSRSLSPCLSLSLNGGLLSGGGSDYTKERGGVRKSPHAISDLTHQASIRIIPGTDSCILTHTSKKWLQRSEMESWGGVDYTEEPGAVR